jgi:recombination protein RecT
MATTQQQNGSGQETPAKRVQYQPQQQVGRVSTLKGLFEQQKDSLAQVLPKHLTAERLLKTLMTAVNRQPELLKCTQSSILESVSRAAELGLEVSGTMGEAYLVPFNNRVGNEWYMQATLIPGWRGLAKLARQSGEIRRIEAEVVFENDLFRYRKGSEFTLVFEPDLAGDRGDPIGAYALVEFKDGGVQAEFMPVRDIESIRKRSKSGSDENGNAIGAWKSDWGEMSRKTVFRRLAKWLPMSNERFARALEQDNADYDLSNVVSVEPEQQQGSRTEALEKRLVGQEEGQPDEPDQSAAGDAAGGADAEAAADAETESDDPAPEAGQDATEEPADPDPRVQALIDQVAEQHSVAADKADAALRKFSKRVSGGEPENLDKQYFKALKAHVKNGDVSLPS